MNENSEDIPWINARSMEELQKLIVEKDNIISHQCKKIESLQTELKVVTEERDSLQRKLADLGLQNGDVAFSESRSPAKWSQKTMSESDVSEDLTPTTKFKQVNQQGKIKFECSFCLKLFTTKRRVLGHIDTRHKSGKVDAIQAEGTKDESYEVVQTSMLSSAGFKCKICEKVLSSKERILQHLTRTHGKSPVKRVKKRYLEDESVSIPERTAYRWKRALNNFEVNDGSSTADERASVDVDMEDFDSTQDADKTNNKSLDASDSDESSIDFDLNCKYNFTECPKTPETLVSEASDEVTVQELVTDEGNLSDHQDTRSEQSFASQDSMISLSEASDEVTGQELVTDEGNLSDHQDTTSEQSFASQDSMIYQSEASDDHSSTDSDDETDSSDEHFPIDPVFAPVNLTNQEQQSLKLLSFFLKNNLTSRTCNDLITTLKEIYPESNDIKRLTYQGIWKFVDDSKINIFHYCPLCTKTFPEDEDVFHCPSPQCEGLRYKGPVSEQLKPNRQPRQSFVFADTHNQLSSLLESPGIWKDIQQNKRDIQARLDEEVDNLTDITDGRGYRQLMEEGKFLSEKNNISCIFNTDGINLYSSSKIELWPIFIAINELSPQLRFARNNMVLIGIWQGKGKPPFSSYMNIFGKISKSLYEEGLSLKPEEGGMIKVKMAVICGTVDLPAKACLLNMTYFNGKHACISCEEEGEVVRQGRGTARCFPYRSENMPPARTQESVADSMEQASEQIRVKGFKGKSSLIDVASLNVVTGIVPDYMHCVLLGATKTLLYLWFSPTQSGNDCFIGRHLKQVSQRLQNIRPPEFIERLPRDLEKHYVNLKATELQTWLLFYGIPCVSGILPEPYLQHFCKLSEGIFILLGDSISPQQLARAAELLKSFYQDFEALYPKGKCGLNIHNIGAHMVNYVILWGPLWCWSTFAFEDSNAAILQMTHGTGNVTKQIMRTKQAQCAVRKLQICEEETRKWKKLVTCGDYSVAGPTKSLPRDEFAGLIMDKLSIRDLSQVQKAFRIVLNNQRHYSAQYSRMQKRICHFVLLKDTKIVSVQYFVVYDNSVCAAGFLCDIKPGLNESYGCHLIPVKTTRNACVIDVSDIVCRLLYINTSKSDGELSDAYVSKLPNDHGHSVFK